MPVASINDAYTIADLRSDAGDQEAAQAISFCGHRADIRFNWLKKLAWACRESNRRKRNNALQIVLEEMSNHDESLASMPMRERMESNSSTALKGT